MRTQWRLVAGVGGVAYLGLDYAAIDRVFEAEDIRGRKKRRRVIKGLQRMEEAALPVLNG